ncbi:MULTISPECIES: lysine transporter LysE [Streptomyces]|uniref:lysine transporter LysE n=1 Tax=Streptomyces TaxID=1883 RepID=UPI000A36873A|nr:lysine transporter LysE [Streptomyces viridochromogenes]
MGIRRAAKGVGDFLVDAAGEAVAEVILSVFACVVLGCLVLTVYLSWSYSPRLTVAGGGLLTLFLACGAWHVFRASGKRRRRGFAALAAVGFIVSAVAAFFLLLYGTGCDCQ